MSLDGGDVDPTPVKIMRDTCCAQSMILERSLPFSTKSATGESILIQGIGMNIINAPLHKMKLNTDLVSETVVVGVRPELPIKGVSMLLRNDLADGKVLPEPIVSNSLCTEVVNEEDKDIFPACAVTTSMTRKALCEVSDDGKGGDGVPSLGLEDSFMTRVDEMGLLPSLWETKSPKQGPASDHVFNCDGDVELLCLLHQRRNSRGGGSGGPECPQTLLTKKFLLTYREKRGKEERKREAKKKGKMEKKRRKIKKREGGKLKMEDGRRKSYQMRRGPCFFFLVVFLFCFVFCFYYYYFFYCFLLFTSFKTTEIYFGCTKMGIFYRVKVFHGKKSGKMTLFPL